jgi:hypothetical protein
LQRFTGYRWARTLHPRAESVPSEADERLEDADECHLRRQADKMGQSIQNLSDRVPRNIGFFV